MAGRTKRNKPEPVSEDSLGTLLGFQLKMASNLFQRELAVSLKPLDLKLMTFAALATVCDNPGISQSGIADSFGVERPNISPVLDELEKRALIMRLRDPSDQRAYIIIPTKAGLALWKQAIKTVAKGERRLVASLDPKEIEKLMSGLSLLRNGTMG